MRYMRSPCSLSVCLCIPPVFVRRPCCLCVPLPIFHFLCGSPHIKGKVGDWFFPELLVSFTVRYWLRIWLVKEVAALCHSRFLKLFMRIKFTDTAYHVSWLKRFTFNKRLQWRQMFYRPAWNISNFTFSCSSCRCLSAGCIAANAFL
jgi:hypothetical protein